MKILKNLLSTAFVLIISAGAVPVGSAAYDVNADIPLSVVYTAENTRFDSLELASKYMRKKLKARETTIELSVPANGNFNDNVNRLIRQSLAETYDGAEGDYLHTALKHYSCNAGYLGGYMNLKFTMEYRTTASQEQYVDKRVNEILESLNIEGMDDYGKITAIYEYIINNVSYAHTSTDNTRFTAYGALYNGEAVCQGFSHLFYRMAKEAGVSCRLITGDAGGGHAWNIAAVNGIYYLLDSTWDIYTTKASQCHYFMRGTTDFDDYDMSEPHVPDSPDESESPFAIDFTSAEFTAMYPVSAVKYDPANPKMGYILGDVDNNGSIDSVDASKVLTAYSMLSTGRESPLSKAQELAGDVNRDGVLNSADASIILRYYSDLSIGGSLSLEEFLDK